MDKNIPKEILLYLPFFQNFSTPHPDFFTEDWSLSIEEYAYLVLPFSLFMSFKLLKRIDKKRIFIWVTFLLILGFTALKVKYYLHANSASDSDWSSSFRKVVIFRVDSIYIGFLLVYAIRKWTNFLHKHKIVLFIFGLLLFFLVHLSIFNFKLVPEINLGFYVFVYLQVVILSLALLFPYLYALNYSGVLLKPVKFISVHSYSIYLVNYSIVFLGLREFFDSINFSFLQKFGLILLFLSCTMFFFNTAL
ncbi:hypothetical protein [Lutibacter sp.]|uniref:hypothetical protein n=1 Tax=Lutibacter sp. TaxID=1925666 RepID=UPI0027335D27|nr:hypothetical protein [Lutibacter sp.]MDP3311907.1 hypothetical protein [Lutibacter sp.]